MTITLTMLAPYEAQLKSDSARERDNAAEILADYLQFGEMPRSSRVAAGLWLFEALRIEQDETAFEAILHAIGVSILVEPCPEWPWSIVGDRLKDMRIPVLGEYGLETLGDSGDPAMISYITPYLQHEDSSIQEFARTAIDQLRQKQTEQ